VTVTKIWLCFTWFFTGTYNWVSRALAERNVSSSVPCRRRRKAGKKLIKADSADQREIVSQLDCLDGMDLSESLRVVIGPLFGLLRSPSDVLTTGAAAMNCGVGTPRGWFFSF